MTGIICEINIEIFKPIQQFLKELKFLKLIYKCLKFSKQAFENLQALSCFGLNHF
jgi:hypothetical protein